ncbi:MAG: heavy-metal-associated domain-containing protein [Acetatifactor sp.]|nr:heavy-metal-associated domain-containing protein [Acetatifactor sp.]
MSEIRLNVGGMMCGMCEAHVKDAIRKLYPDAKNIRANHAKNEASFLLKEQLPEVIIRHELEKTLSETGYELTGLKIVSDGQKSGKG